MSTRVSFQHISVRDAETLIQNEKVVILDVRDAESYKRSHIDGALNVTISDLFVVLKPTPKDSPILLCCYHGYASQEYGQLLSDFRYTRVYSLDGGYEAWVGPISTSPTLDAAMREWLGDNGYPADNIEAVAENGFTPLMRASQQGRDDIVAALLTAGAKRNTKNIDGNNALWFACVANRPDLVDDLINAGVDLDNRNDNGATPMMYSASTGRPTVLARLLARGADLSIETLDGFSALDVAATLECLTLLRQEARRRIGTRAQVAS